MKFRSVVSRFTAVSIRIKIVGLVAICILFSSAAMVWYTNRDAQMGLRHSALDMGTTLAGVLAGQTLGLSGSGNTAALQTMVAGYVEANEDIYYIRVSDSTGTLIAETSRSPEAAGLVFDNPPLSPTIPQIQSREFNGQEITDIALSIPGAGQGAIHIGLTDANISATVGVHMRHILLWLVVVYLVDSSPNLHVPLKIYFLEQMVF